MTESKTLPHKHRQRTETKTSESDTSVWLCGRAAVQCCFVTVHATKPKLVNAGARPTGSTEPASTSMSTGEHAADARCALGAAESENREAPARKQISSSEAATHKVMTTCQFCFAAVAADKMDKHLGRCNVLRKQVSGFRG